MAFYFSSKEWVEFIPTLNDNHKSENPAKCEIKVLSRKEIIEHAERFSKIQDDDLSVEKIEEVNKEYFCKYVRNLQNFFIDGKEIKDPLEFFEKAKGPDANNLIAEIINAILRYAGLTRQEEKNSVEPSTSL